MRPLLFAALLALTLVRSASLMLWLRRRWIAYRQLDRLASDHRFYCKESPLTPMGKVLGWRPRARIEW